MPGEPHAPQPFAVFDIDGTVGRGDLTMEIAKAMSRRQLIPGADYPAIEAAEESWRRLRTDDAYRIYIARTLRGPSTTIWLESTREIMTRP